MNFGLNTVIGDDETGFRGVSDEVYRTEGWEFVIAGGGLYDNLDYSFAAGYEDGTFQYPATQPGGGSPALRRQLKILADFINGFDFVRMAPDNTVIKEGTPPGGSARALVDPGRAIAIYLRRKSATPKNTAVVPVEPAASATLRVELAPGEWRAEWIDTTTGSIVRALDINGGGVRDIPPPDYTTDIALRLRRK